MVREGGSLLSPQNLTPLSNDEVLENKNIEVSALIEKNESKNENIIISKENQEKDDGQLWYNWWR